MASSNVNYRKTHFNQTNINPNHDKNTFEMFHNFCNKTKVNVRSVYYHLRHGTHGPLGLDLTVAQYSIVIPTAFRRPLHPCPLIITSQTTTNMITTMRNEHIEAIRVFCKVLVVKYTFIQKNITAVEETYLADICNCSSKSITITIIKFLTQLQDNYRELLPHKLP